MTSSSPHPARVWIAHGPSIILIEPQMAENIGTAARAMANFGLPDLRLVRPRDWPSKRAYDLASGANRILDGARCFDTAQEAIADLHRIYATTARDRGMAKPVLGPQQGAEEMCSAMAGGQSCGILFGRERTGLYSDEVALADAILTYPVNPAFASLNLAQAVLIIGYEWMKTQEHPLPFAPPDISPPATKDQLLGLFEHLETELEAASFFRPPEKKPTMVRNLRNIFHRLSPSQQDIQTLRGVITALCGHRLKKQP